MFKTLEELIEIIRSRKNATKDKSYTNQLLNNKTLSKEKTEEELQELLEAIQLNKNQTHEAADLIYHLLVLLECNDIKIEDVMDELKKRQQQSGLDEKASR
ncbi:MAG: phosphoribosyl-ATP diphosphatase [Pelagibacteraceae bacterium]|jgi:phosphoribosyl-ATP pyrophosphohydrolase|uniref:phosphoribosyl-ATP diphosphatase n=1 Tax=Pelagibacter sp. (strain IMCC9063) TaxID=1002672 RepID=UPI0002046794|nr:phosphoribosyl-ATP diphosphatase [Candidatus Pelagibacter sp. IMCC9063]AEA80885.1 phosphoribosyl-ATP diphosphatase [Candidatus Pelagibacter sp. IMCC9063]MDA9168454.1 phosphoribosyl-ATP diphosphatase [Pelagibacteraceae bacterium]|tara:strand:- start:842 stop:1144 length:303 start_codon:yes stop_codon:yes gene_type:complete